MKTIERLDLEQQLDIEAEILRHIWYEGKASPSNLSIELEQDPNIVCSCLDDLVTRACVYEFVEAPEDGDNSIYCLTKRAKLKLHDALKGFGRYKLKTFWMSFNREDVAWLTSLSHSS